MPTPCPVPAWRSIPARAGETVLLGVSALVPQVYPRTGGGNAFTASAITSLRGLSPHGRGKLGPIKVNLLRPRSIPARAGETFPKPA